MQVIFLQCQLRVNNYNIGFSEHYSTDIHISAFHVHYDEKAKIDGETSANLNILDLKFLLKLITCCSIIIIQSLTLISHKTKFNKLSNTWNKKIL